MAAHYSDEIIEEVRAANDIVDVISGYVHLEKKGSRYFGLCPFHNDKNPSFSVSQGDQMYFCFGCHAAGNVYTFMMEYENLSFPEAVQNLAERARIELPKQEMNASQRRREDRRTKLLEINKEAATYFYSQLRAPQGERAMSYLAGRGLSRETMRNFGLGYSNKYSDDLYKYLKQKGWTDDLLKDSGLVMFDEKRGGCDRFWNRVMFPIMDTRNRVIAFGGRVMGDGTPKYVNSPETPIFDKSNNLYGLNIARKSKLSGILLCEGYMDVISLHQAGFDNAAAALGTAFTSGHANQLRRYTKEVYLTLDSDDAGKKAALRAIPILKEAGLSVRVVDMSPHKDPDEFIKALGVDEYRKRIDDAENSFMFEVRMLSTEYNLNDPEGNTEFFRRVSRMMRRFPDRLERENYIRAVADTYHVGFDQLNDMVTEEARKTGSEPAPPPRRFIPKDEKKDEYEIDKAQSMLLTWLSREPSVFDAVARYIGPDDFTDEICRQAAEEIFAQHAGGEVNPARIVDMFSDEALQRAVAGIFHADIPSGGSLQNRQKALNETVRRVKLESIEYRSAHRDPEDLGEMQRLIEERKRLESINIPIN